MAAMPALDRDRVIESRPPGLISNLLLDELDRELERRGHRSVRCGRL
jgi:hypothetical protein